MTPEQAKQICIEAHSGQWRRPESFDNFNHMIENHEISKLQNGAIDHIVREGCKYLMDHHLQLFKCRPYNSHPIAVADMMETDEEKVVAYLHDVIEDCDGYLTTVEHYRTSRKFLVIPSTRHLISDNVYYALNCLTKQPEETYSQYVKNISCNKLATKIKIADITHNLSSNPSDKAKVKYQKAIKQLLKGI